MYHVYSWNYDLMYWAQTIISIFADSNWQEKTNTFETKCLTKQIFADIFQIVVMDICLVPITYVEQPALMVHQHLTVFPCLLNAID